MPHEEGHPEGASGGSRTDDERDHQREAEADPSSGEDEGDIVEEESEGSFPASDAPSSWARSPDDEQP